MLRLHILPTFRSLDLDEITSPRVRAWRAERLETTAAATVVAKAYRLLKAILETAAEEELIRRNPCRIKGAGKEEADEGFGLSAALDQLAAARLQATAACELGDTHRKDHFRTSNTC
ncbi:MAG: hypothetical protein QOF84_5708 [Streptomyces sp.]|nr:hypothetical protein [Streptomyces sp.]